MERHASWHTTDRSGNGFARHYGIPLKLEDARMSATGKDRLVDAV